MPDKILLVDDEPMLLETLAFNLRASGYEVVTAADGAAAMDQARAEKPDLVILDLMLPEVDGLTVCRNLRQSSDTPILVLTARTGELDKIVGLESGADDYMTKPFSLPELLARLRALLRRAEDGHEALLPDTLSFGEVRLDFQRFIATRGGTPVHLTPKEFALIRYLAAQEGVAVRRDLLIDHVWGEDVYPTNRTVDTHVLSLRNKLEPDPERPRHLLTVHGVGYRFVGDT